MRRMEVSIQLICESQVKAYDRLCNYINRAKTFKWVSRGRLLEDRRKTQNYPGQITLETTSEEIGLAWASHRSPETVGAFVGSNYSLFWKRSRCSERAQF